MADFNLCSAGSSATMVEGLLMPISGSVFEERKKNKYKKRNKTGSQQLFPRFRIKSIKRIKISKTKS